MFLKNKYTFFLVTAFLLSLFAGRLIGLNHFKTLLAQGHFEFAPIVADYEGTYSFDDVKSSFNPGVKLDLIREIPKDLFHDLILETLSNDLKLRLDEHIDTAIKLAESHQIDPFWVVSIMMTESHFNTSSVSSKNARGLMQVRPKTAEYLAENLGLEINQDEVADKLSDPEFNMSIGVYYLGKLLKSFRNNYAMATVAYNLGPNELRRRLKEENYDYKGNNYFNKVKVSYTKISARFQNFSKIYPNQLERSFVWVERDLKTLKLLEDLNLMAQYQQDYFTTAYIPLQTNTQSVFKSN